jgi:arylsulfatase A
MKMKLKELNSLNNCSAIGVLILFSIIMAACTSDGITNQPNIILVFCDDLGYGDIGVYGHPTINTPHLDRLANEGQRFTNFYATAPFCSPSRAGLLTGRYQIRSGLNWVLFPHTEGGLPESEVTMAEVLKSAGYATACIGKWHLGKESPHLPRNQGFDYYFGIPYSNDMDKPEGVPKNSTRHPDRIIEWFNVPLMRNEEIIEKPAQQHTITKRYISETVAFIKEKAGQPFFIYLPHSMPHVPLFSSEGFVGKSLQGDLGDAIEEIDWGMGELINALEEVGQLENTLIVFTSDNGPSMETKGASAGLLRGGKGTTWEGGMREPAIFYWKGKIQPMVQQGMASTLDLLPTFCSFAGAPVPADRELDGFDLSETLLNRKESPRTEMYYYNRDQLCAVRKGSYKLHFKNRFLRNPDKTPIEKEFMLFNLDQDPAERFDITEQYPEIVNELKELAEHHKATTPPGTPVGKR